MPEITETQMACMFNIFKWVLLAGATPGDGRMVDGRMVDVESALTRLDSTVVQISDGVQTGIKFVTTAPTTLGSDDNFTTPARKGKKVVKKEGTPQMDGLLQAGSGETTPAVAQQPMAHQTPTFLQDSDRSSAGDNDIVFSLDRSHKGSSTKSYSMYARFLAIEDWFAGMA